MIKVAVILPTYNVALCIKDMLNALYKSTNFPFKLIIVDGFSTDRTKESIVEFVRENNINNVEIYQIPKKGLVNAINFGIQKAEDLDVYLTQVDVIHYKMYKKDWLQYMYECAQEEKVGAVTGLGGWGISGDSFIDGLKWFGTWNSYIKRDTINKIGLFDEQFSGGDDIDYSYRIQQAGLNVVVCDYWVHHHQLTDRNDTHSGEHIIEMGKLFRKKWGLDIITAQPKIK